MTSSRARLNYAQFADRRPLKKLLDTADEKENGPEIPRDDLAKQATVSRLFEAERQTA